MILSAVLLFARLLAPGRFELELDVYILVLGALAVFDVVLAARRGLSARGALRARRGARAASRREAQRAGRARPDSSAS